MTKNIYIALILCYTPRSLAQKIIPNKSEMCATLTEIIQNDCLYRLKTPDKFSRGENEYSEKQIDSMNVLQKK